MPIVNRAEAQKIVAELHSDQKIVVFTNGCFDILHRGHVSYLQRAQQLGDCLIVGLNSDASVERLKGKLRPYQVEQDRAAILEALKMIDLVVLFDEDTPLKLICELKPNILVKGGDYDLHSIVGADEVTNWGGSVEILPFLNGYGTTQLVAKILKDRIL